MKKKCFVQGYATVPFMLELDEVGYLSEAIEKLDQTLHSDTVAKIKLKIVKFNGEELEFQPDDIMIEWESIEIEDELIKKEDNALKGKSSG